MGKKYLTKDDLYTLRYGSIMIMTDQDHDGSHIKGLLINFIHNYWPELLSRHPGFLKEFITPIIKVSRGVEKLAFFTIPEYEKWA
jgi:DNA topoisomerase-2